MGTRNGIQFNMISEKNLEPVLELLKGGAPDAVARKAGISREQLFQMRDDLLAQRQQAQALSVPSGEKIGRNAPCPCGSGKKYKHCCLPYHEAARQTGLSNGLQARQTKGEEQARLIQSIQKTFDRLSSGRPGEAIQKALKQIERYPNEDRLHDILATGYLYTGEWEAAIHVCERRLTAAESEKAYFIKHGRYRDAEIDKPALSYYYPPQTWLQKYWIALKARDYHRLYPSDENKGIDRLVKALQAVDDTSRFPKKHAQGMASRREALQPTMEQLKRIGPQTIPYIRPLAVKYSWSGLFVPEILSFYESKSATQTLIDISMFGFAYASGASLHYLEVRGDAAVGPIAAALAKDRKFDAIKTGIVSVLGNIQSPAAFKILMDLLAHESPHIVNWAGGAVSKYNDVSVLPALMAASERIGRQQMIERAIEKLKDLESAV